ncbi:hypothetical protein [Herbihabitans rhizosphaerae]|nr:hypothetical protein [Herbihabitans rhizosphaerae]
MPSYECNGKLIAISAESATSVWTLDSKNAYQWTGQSWTTIPLPVSATGTPFWANDISVVGGTTWIVGRLSNGDKVTTEIYKWQNGSWQRALLPLPAGENTVASVHAVAPDNVWAVGTIDLYSPANKARALVLHWNGTSWNYLPAPGLAPLQTVQLNAVTVAAGQAWVGGALTTYESNNISVKSVNAFLMRRDGSTWTVTPSPEPQPGPASYNGPRVLSLAVHGSEVWAGGSHSVDGRTIGLLIRWDGQAWRPATPTPPFTEYDVKALSSKPGHGLWAVGHGTRVTDPQATGDYVARLTG